MSKRVSTIGLFFVLVLAGASSFASEKPGVSLTPVPAAGQTAAIGLGQRPEVGKQLVEFTPPRVAGLLTVLLLTVETLGALLAVGLLVFIPIQIHGIKRELRELREEISSARSEFNQTLPLILEATQQRRLRRFLDDDIFEPKSTTREEVPQ